MVKLIANSSNIRALAHDGARSLVVVFHNGGIYEYGDVPADIAKEVAEAESVGRAFHRLIKAAGYTSAKRAELPGWAGELAEAIRARESA